MDTWEMGQLLFNRGIIARENSECNLAGNIWDKAWRAGLAAKTGPGY